MNRKTYFLFQFSRKYLMVLGILIFITDHATTDFSSDIEKLIQQAAKEIPWGGKQIRIGLGDFTFRDTGKTSEFSSTLTDEVRLGLSNEGKFQLINRSQLEELLRELSFQLRDLSNPKTAKQIGKVEGLDAMLFANFDELPGNRVKIILSFVNVETWVEHVVGGEVERPAEIQIEPEPEEPLPPSRITPPSPSPGSDPTKPPPLEPLLPRDTWVEAGMINSKFVLDGFRTGEFIHDDWEIWVQRFAKQIRIYEKHYSVRDITAKGFADGQRNDGVSDWSQVHEKCRHSGKNRGKLNDSDLAKVRGCELQEQIYQIMRERYPDPLWNLTEFFDYPDDGQDRPELRKVEIQVKMRQTK